MITIHNRIISIFVRPSLYRRSQAVYFHTTLCSGLRRGWSCNVCRHICFWVWCNKVMVWCKWEGSPWAPRTQNCIIISSASTLAQNRIPTFNLHAVTVICLTMWRKSRFLSYSPFRSKFLYICSKWLPLKQFQVSLSNASIRKLLTWNKSKSTSVHMYRNILMDLDAPACTCMRSAKIDGKPLDEFNMDYTFIAWSSVVVWDMSMTTTTIIKLIMLIGLCAYSMVVCHCFQFTIMYIMFMYHV